MDGAGARYAFPCCVCSPPVSLFLHSLEQPYLCIVTEIVQRGSLFDIIHDEHNALTWPKCLSIATDVASGKSPS